MMAAQSPVPPESRILLVEDDAMVRRALAEWLGIAGWVVREAEDAASALALLGEEAFDLVLSDVRMPGLSGLVAHHWFWLLVALGLGVWAGWHEASGPDRKQEEHGP